MNLVRLKQIESGEFRPLIEGLATGVVLGASGSLVNYINLTSGNLQAQIDAFTNATGVGNAFTFSLSSGISDFSYNYGSSIQGYPIVNIYSTGANDPIILAFVTGFNTTGVRGGLSHPTLSSSYKVIIHI